MDAQSTTPNRIRHRVPVVVRVVMVVADMTCMESVITGGSRGVK